MVPGASKRVALQKKLQLLQNITHSRALTEAKIVMDATKYIKELKGKVDRLNKDLAGGAKASNQAVEVSVETFEKGFLIGVFCQRSCPGLLVHLLNAFEEVGIYVEEARVSCAETFHIQAFGQKNEGFEGDCLNKQSVEEAIFDGIKKWTESGAQD